MAGGEPPPGYTSSPPSPRSKPTGGDPLLQTSAPARIEPVELARAQQVVANISRSFDAKVVGQARLRESLLVGLLTGGHILLESVPGLAKTTAAQTVAEAVSAEFRRIQCTPDLLPSDIVGTQIYDAAKGTFITQLGPVHANIVLLDEINRSSAKTQSAMLEAMQEQQTSIGGQEYKLPSPFLVLATQNPIEQEGTYQLPEAQMDRFMLKDVLDYPSPAEETEILRRIDAGVFTAEQKPAAAASLDAVLGAQDLVRRIYIDPAIINYIVGLVYVTRNAGQYIDRRLAEFIEFGASPRASIAFSRAARAVALLNGRDHVIPEDVKSLAHRVLRHRLILGFDAIAEQVPVESVIDAIVASVQTP
jgi:MoxR-like ATPase